MKHRSITLTKTQEKAFRVATKAHTEKVHWLWYPQDSGVELDEFIEDANKVGEGEWLMQSWSGSVTCKHIPIWERKVKDGSDLGPDTWKDVGYYDPETGNLVLK